ncbi:MAG: hypothetical protein V2A73_10435 [Pseudomonadota bacterium]
MSLGAVASLPGRTIAPAIATALAVVVVVVVGAAGSQPAHAAPPMKGVALGLYHHEADERGFSFSTMLGEIKELGADYVSLVVSWKQHDTRSSTIASDKWATVPDNRLRAVIREARRRGLEVFLFPIIDLDIRRPLEWRGALAPKDIDLWWRHYERFVIHYARIAADEGVALFSIGSELCSTESWRDRWLHLIEAVERVYSGTLLYSANWDHYEQVSFWERLDYLGVTAYNEITRDRDAAESQLATAWTEARSRLAAFASTIGKRIVITEVGYTSRDGTALHPWDYSGRGALDTEEQRRCYGAFVSVWKEEPSLFGVYFWNWFGAGGARDTTYTPKGKPAETVLRAWYGAAYASP